MIMYILSRKSNDTWRDVSDIWQVFPDVAFVSTVPLEGNPILKQNIFVSSYVTYNIHSELFWFVFVFGNLKKLMAFIKPC